jgi:hypothetical protein
MLNGETFSKALKALFCSITVLFAGDISRPTTLNHFAANRSFDNHDAPSS